MERKLISQGGQALTVSLPIGWIRKHNLHAKDVIHLEEKNHKLEISTEQRAPVTEITVDLTGKSRLSMILSLDSKYIQGYDTIRIKHDNLGYVQEAANLMMGMVIEDFKDNQCTLRNIVKVPETDAKKLIIKATHILRQQAESLLLLVKREIKLEKLISEETLLDINLMYCLRYLNKYTSKSSHAYFLICTTLDLISDNLGEIAKFIDKDKNNNVAIATKIRNVIKEYIRLLLKSDFEKLNKLVLDFQDSLVKKNFLEGIAYSVGETMYNYMYYIADELHKKEEK